MDYNILKDTGIPWLPKIPENWSLKRTKYLFKVNKNIVGKESSSYNVLSLTTRGVIKRDLESGMGKFPASFDGYNLIKPNSVLLCLFDMDVTPRIVGHVDLEGIVSSAYTNIIPTSKINSKYYYYYFIHQDKNKILLALGTGIRITLGWDVFGSLKVPVPPLETQNSIVEYLDRKTQQIQEFIAKKEMLIELLEEKRRESIDKIIHNVSDYKTNTKPLKHIVKFISEQTNKKEDYEHYIALENIESWSGRIDMSIGEDVFESSVKRFTDTDILFSKLRPYLAKVVIPEFNGVCVGEILVLRPKKKVLREYLFYKLISRQFIDFVDSSTFGSKMPRASWDFIGKIEITFPVSQSEQKTICDKIKQMELSNSKLKAKAKLEIEKAKEYQESLITQVVTGQLQVPDKTTRSLEYETKMNLVAESENIYSSNK